MNPTEQAFAFNQKKLEDSINELKKTQSILSRKYRIMVFFTYLSKTSIIVFGLVIGTNFFESTVAVLGFLIALLTGLEPLFLNSALIGELGSGATKLSQTFDEVRLEHNEIVNNYIVSKKGKNSNGPEHFVNSLGDLEAKVSNTVLNVKKKIERAKVTQVKKLFKGGKH
ncbi:hypothetical protein Q4574_11135 [Aliiglaciecola sp. 3_MG-2023]|uniref:hypothetical protein n=1 Tax=Aliiglaciecola sp. 3_MG-2023 TaxID=3062644 RepID=UPI0026E298C5|nr:hypothetical protein [Aliiglaciecola sp. 3_MG-2023]MDO6693843.1 hypothetical protein [Aliiglaciecola sp. 3_MG-2023]